MDSDVTNFSRDRVYMDQDADDLALIARCRAGETAAFEGLVVRYQRVLFTVAVRMLGDADAADDAAQNAFIKAYQKLGDIRSEPPVLQLDLPDSGQRVPQRPTRSCRTRTAHAGDRLGGGPEQSLSKSPSAADWCRRPSCRCRWSIARSSC